MANNVKMDANFLINSLSSWWNDNNHRSCTYQVDCNPGYVPYLYKLSYGSYEGSWRADGIWRGNVNDLAAQIRAGYRGELWEGIKLISIAWRRNGGSWNYLDASNPIVKFTCNKNGETFNVQASYEIWSQGMPHRDVPFMWFSGKGSIWYNNGNNKFNTGAPHDPDRSWAGIDHPSGCNSGWVQLGLSWKQPGRDDDWACWTFWHSHKVATGTWTDGCCQCWKSGMPYKSPHDGWTGYSSGQAPQGRRKSLWWRFGRTISVNWTSANIKEMPDPLSIPYVTLNVTKNYTTAYNEFTNVNTGEKISNYYGCSGYVKYSYYQNQGRDGLVEVYAHQLINGQETKVKVIEEKSVKSGYEYTRIINFYDFPELKRGYEIRYSLQAWVWDADYNCWRESGCNIYGWDNRCQNHVYSEEPKWPNNVWIESSDRTKQITVHWDQSLDPDWGLDSTNNNALTWGGAAHKYYIHIWGDKSNNNLRTAMPIKCMTYDNYSERIMYYNKSETLYSKHSGTSYTFDTSNFQYGENLSITVIPGDGFWNNYFYGREIGVSVSKPVKVSIKVAPNWENLDSNGVYSGEHGTVKLTYEHEQGKSGHIYLCAMTNNLDGRDWETGTYIGVIHDKDVHAGESYWLDLQFKDFCNGRSKYIKYFAFAQDIDGTWSYLPLAQTDQRMWSQYAVGFHYFNNIPWAVTPYVSENQKDAFDDDILEIAWPAAFDSDYDKVGYRLYIENTELSNNKMKKFANSNYVNGTLVYDTQTRYYTDVVDLGYIDAPTNINPFKLDLRKYLGANTRFYVETYDMYNSPHYNVGNYLDLDIEGVPPEIPVVMVESNYRKDFYGYDKEDGDKGYVTVSYTHPRGRDATVDLYAMVHSLLDDSFKVIETPVATWNLTSGSYSPRTLLDYSRILGEQYRSYEIRYYAVATTRYGETSLRNIYTDESIKADDCLKLWLKDIKKYPEHYFSNAYGTHVFNAQPTDTTVELYDENNASNLHYNAIFRWSPSVDNDTKTSDPFYAVVLKVYGQEQKEMNFTYGADRKQDKILSYTEMWDTQNTEVEIDLTQYDEGQEFELWVVPHDNYVNDYFYTSNSIKFKRATFGKPIIEYSVEQNHSEHGKLHITYLHESAEMQSNGSYICTDPERNLNDLKGTVDVYGFVGDKLSLNFTSIRNVSFEVGETKTFDVNFEEVSPYNRSVNIHYLIHAYDNDKIENFEVPYNDRPGIDLFNLQEENGLLNAPANHIHYYNDEPYDTQIEIGEMDKPEDKHIYEFEYINLSWLSPIEPDNDAIVYYAYIKMPESLNEPSYTHSIVGRFVQYDNFEYNRKYRIRETADVNGKRHSIVHYYKPNTDEWIKVSDNEFVGLKLQYTGDHLGTVWPEREDFTIYLECRDHRSWDNSYYGTCNDIFTIQRKRHDPPNLVKLEVTPNLPMSGNGEEGSVKILYTHPEGDIEGTVSIYAYQDGKLKCKIHEGIYQSGVQQTATIYFKDSELDIFDDIPDNEQLSRSKEITYFAEAVDNLVGMSCLDRFKDITDTKETPGVNIDLKHIPLLEADENGNYAKQIITYDGLTFNFNKDGHYIGPVQVGAHYFNEEPPYTNVEEYNPEELVPYKVADLKWKHVKDPDNHEVNYELYVRSSIDAYNKELDDFYTDDKQFIAGDQNIIKNSDGDIATEDSSVFATGTLSYSKKITIPASSAAQAAEHFSVLVDEYPEDSTLDFWITSKDPYINSYYRSGKILTVEKGHKARDIRAVYPRNDSVVYNTRPRILIYLGEDTLKQTTYVGWKEKVYNNKDNPECFSSLPNKNNVIVFQPPVPYTTLHDTKVSFYVYSFNQCTYSEKFYVTYTYKNFFEEFVDDKLIPLKALHVNEFRKCANILRNAYGLETIKYTRDIVKNNIFENYDFNETKNALTEINDLINNADTSEELDYHNPLIVTINDLDPVDYEGLIGNSSYNEFLEWARLLYLLENM